MSWEITAGPSWQGGCVRRIRAAAAALTFAAQRNLIVINRKDCDASRYGFPRELMAKDFREKARALAEELLYPEMRTPESPHPPAYAAADDLPAEVKGALDWLANVFGQQMNYWGWDEEHWSDDAPQLVYRISEADLAKLQRCVQRLDEALDLHPGPEVHAPSGQTHSPSRVGLELAGGRPKNGWERFCESWEWLKQMTPPPDPPKATRVEKVRRLNGRDAVVDLGKATMWTGKPNFDFGCEVSYGENLYRTKGGRWVMNLVYSCPGGVIYGPEDLSPPDELNEVTLERVVQWFIEDWAAPKGSETEVMPAEIADRIALMDIDHPDGENSPEFAGPPTGPNVDEPEPAPTPEPRGQKDEKRWRVIRAYHRRLARNESLSVRSIADEANCTPGYVSKVLAGLRPDKKEAAPPGMKGRDGEMEASA